MASDQAATAHAAAAVRDHFRREIGREPEGVWAAPGRVNLIGEHTDYNAGLVLPLAIDRHTWVAAARRDDDVVRAWSAQEGATPAIDLRFLPAAATGWAGYVAGAVWALREAGLPVGGLDVVVTSDVPVGSGLSSSAALTCATVLAATQLSGLDVDRMTLALAAQRAEHDIVGAPVGLMDQMASLFGRRDAALLVDCRSLDVDVVPMPADLALVVVDTHVRHDHAAGAYAKRRQECEEAARRLDLPTLRDATVADVGRLPPPLQQRARHVVTENARVVAAVDAMRAGKLDLLGQLMLASHRSLRHDFQVSVPQLDVAVDAAMDAGVLGARLTGGGFGGAVVAASSSDRIEAVRSGVAAAFARHHFAAPSVHVVASAGGAARVILT